jgi:glyoxylase I family protein
MGHKLNGVTPLLMVFDMIETVRFYRDLLGFEVVGASPLMNTPEGRFSHWVWLRRDGADVTFNTAYDSGERPPVRDEAHWAGHADTWLYFACEDVDACYAQVVSKGIDAPPPALTSYGQKNFQISDPDGYTLVFQGKP